VRQQGALRVIGGLFLCYLGLRTFLARPAEHAARAAGAGLLGAFASTFGLTLANPTTILSFVAVFAGLGIAGAGSWREATVLVGGVFLGSALWWLMLTGTVGALRSRVDPTALR
jgi:threonine/homoserine/homoserine lactone efflux protein